MYVVVLSEPDPVAAGVARRWGTPPATGEHVEGSAIRRLSDTTLCLRRPGPHVRDERLDLRLPATLSAERPTLVFPSIHRSEQNVECFTVHALGNPGARAEIGGRPRSMVPTDPHAMSAVLRALAERAGPIGLSATYEATHHGPELALPALFAEIGYGASPEPPTAALDVLAESLRAIAPDERDRPVLGIGGGHYAPHFTQLALRRSWAFGHILSRHALEEIDAATARAAYAATPGAQGLLFARAQDAGHPALAGLGERLRDGDAPVR